MITLLMDDSDIIAFFKDDQDIFGQYSIIEFANNDGISNSENIKAMWLIIHPFTIDVLAVADVDDGWAIKFAFPPMRSIER